MDDNGGEQAAGEAAGPASAVDTVDCRFVARPGTVGELGRAYLRYAHRTPGQWAFYGVFAVIVLLTWVLTFDSSAGMGARMFWAVVFTVPVMVLIVAVSTTLAYIRFVRGARLRVYPGAVLESSFSEEAVRLRNPLGESCIDFRAIRSVTLLGRAALMRQHGLPVVSVYPRELFPEVAVHRVRQVSGRPRP